MGTSYESLKQDAELVLWMQQKCREDVLFLAREVLGYDLVDYDLDYHKMLRHQTQHLGESLTLAPRSYIKSTIITIAGTIWYLLNNPEHCVLIVSSRERNAQKFLLEIAQHFRANKTLRLLFPLHCPQKTSQDPTREKLIIPCRQKPRREASVEVTGVEASLAGRHYEVIVCDDIVHERNVPPWASEQTLENVWEGYRSLRSLLRHGVVDGVVPHVRLVGTRWHDGDVYGRITADPDLAEMSEMYVCEPYGNSWYSPEGKTWFDRTQLSSREDGVLWESSFPEYYLKKWERHMGSYMWACNMSNDPLPPDSATKFDSEWFHEFDMEDYKNIRNELNVAITIDPAFQESSKSSDRTAIAVTGIHTSGAVYVLAVDAGKHTPSQIVDIAVALWEMWPDCLWVGVECDSGGRAIYNDLRDHCRWNGLDIPVRDLWTEGQRKDARVARLHARVQRCGLYYHKGIRMDYIDEILRYPVGRWRDVPDCIAYRTMHDDRPKPAEKQTTKKRREIPGNVHTGADLLRKLEVGSSSWNPWRLN